MLNNQVQEFLSDLKKHSDSEKAKGIAGYLKTSQLLFIGVRLPLIHKTTTKHIKEIPVDRLPDFMKSIWKERVFEVRRAAIDVMEKYVKTGDVDVALQIMSMWIDDIDTWALMDPLCSPCLGTLLLRDEELEKTFLEWQTSSNFWRRRASVLPYLHLAKKTFYKVENTTKILKMASPHISDKEFFVGKAAAWVIRELSKRNPSAVKEFIEKNKEKD